MKPIIAITPEVKFQPETPRSRGEIKLNWNYAEEIEKAGGCPVIIPPHADKASLASWIHGWLIPGGLDIHAERFGEEDHPAVDLQDRNRYDSEEGLLKAISKEVPIFGICYGSQFLNVALGGTLVQHLPDHVDTEHTGGPVQEYKIRPGTKLSEIVGANPISGQSWHHQAVGKLGRGLQICAEHEDGTIEGIESTEHPWLVGVQWHPERTPENPASQNLFRAFVQAANQYRMTR